MSRQLEMERERENRAYLTDKLIFNLSLFTQRRWGLRQRNDK